MGVFDEKETLANFQRNLWVGRLFRSFAKHPPETYQEAYNRALENFLNHVLAQSVKVKGNILHIADRVAFWTSIWWTKLSRWLTRSSIPEYFSSSILNLGDNSASLILLEKGAFISPKGFFRVVWCFPFFNS